METFSQQIGLEPRELPFQLESVSEQTRSRLWNCMCTTIWNNWDPEVTGYARNATLRKYISGLLEDIWHDHFRAATDTIPAGYGWYGYLRNEFFNCSWNRSLDFLQFVVQHVDAAFLNQNLSIGRALARDCNQILIADSSAYRFSGLKILPLTNETELESIEVALAVPDAAVRKHLSAALDHLADRTNPDYRNSVKESISAVEAICQSIAGNKSASLPDCLRVIKVKHPIHGAFEQALNKLYGYTSDGDGIRHCLSDVAATLSSDDAKFMLVTCSAFVNYLVSIAAAEGIELQPL